MVSLQVHYRAPARLDDVLAVSCEPQAEGLASMRFIQRIHRDATAAAAAQLLVEANVRVACIDARTLRPKRLPDFMVQDSAESETLHG